MAILLSLSAFIIGLIAGALAMFVVIRWTQLYRTRITEKDVGRNTWLVFMQQLDD